MDPYPTFRLTRYLSARWAHGGGACPGVLQWRWRGRLLSVVSAGQA